MAAKNSTWIFPPTVLRLSKDEVHVWRAMLDQPRHRAFMFRLLGADEQERAARFRFQKDLEYFIVARGILRGLLGRYLNRERIEIRFNYNNYGKPAVTGNPEDKPLHFNLSHSNGLGSFRFYIQSSDWS